MLQGYDFSGARLVNTQATFFKYVSGSAGGMDASIVLRVDGVTVGKYTPGDTVSLPDVHKVWSIEPVTANCIGSVVIGFGAVTSTNLQGTVQTVDGGRARSLAGLAFSAYGYAAGSAGNFPFVQLWNKSTDKNLVVNGIVLVSSLASGHNLRYSQAVINASDYMAGAAKKASAAASAAGVIKVNNAASVDAFSLAPNSNRFFMSVQSSVTQQWRPTEPLIVPPGWGVTLSSVNSGADSGVTFEWFEESI